MVIYLFYCGFLIIEFTHIIPCYFTHTRITIKVCHYILVLGIETPPSHNGYLHCIDKTVAIR